MKKIDFQLQESASFDAIDTLILPVYEDASSITLANSLNLEAQLTALKASGDFEGKSSQTLLLTQPSSIDLDRILLIGLGDKAKLTEKNYLAACQAVAKALENSGATNLLNALSLVSPANTSAHWPLYQNTLALQKSFYDYNHKSRGAHIAKQPKLSKVVYVAPATAENHNPIQQAQSTALGMALTQDLANMPSNFCTPTYLAETAQELGNHYGFDVTVLERDQMTEMGMGSFMAVAQGAIEPPKMITLSYQGAGDAAPVALVGKGVTFDTGGISLKPGAAMDEMKYDMGGAATVLGVFKALGEIKPNINVVGIIPATENMPSGNAIKPGDVVTSLSGQTIEILNTDAEGRLILCDALTYVQQTFKPAKVIDMATLTGACIIALGHQISAVLGNDQALVDNLLKAGQKTYDRFWQLPLSEEFDEQLKSNFADMANIGGRPAGTITAAQFLARYTKEVNWAHLDIAGTAWTSGANKGATGRPVPALIEYLVTEAN